MFQLCRGLSSAQATRSLFRLVVSSQLVRCTQLLLAKEKPPPAESHSPSRIFGAILSVMLTCGIICITVAATVSFTQVSPKPLSQVMRLNFQNRPGSSMNQSVVVSKAKKTITYYITSSSNQTTIILFDCKNSYVCYKLSGHSNCYLKRMNARDQDAAQASFNLSKHKILQSSGSSTCALTSASQTTSVSPSVSTTFPSEGPKSPTSTVQLGCP
ncbi:BRICHOS domain-containing protein 5 isoform X3 [Ahaetulla prasina]|uniref:BRICHOS domain-containing protein 5 isoform X3 n=1 Tax=Ahaetulla prasina TaxID=499056 RepID=UPI0026497488|nr:BRICHOS domain-containing protein 5 isoform X3 [Ahaetulla prasina]